MVKQQDTIDSFSSLHSASHCFKKFESYTAEQMIDMQQQTPCQQLIAKDLHGNEWHFQHVNQISLFVNCYFALKAWNAQNGGALAILVLDDKNEQMITMDTPEEENADADYLPRCIRALYTMLSLLVAPPGFRIMATLDETMQMKPKPVPKRFVKNQIPETILNDSSLNAGISLLPSNYNLEVHKCVWRIRSTRAKRLALQLPEGLLLYSLILSDIFTAFAGVTHYFVLGDVTYGACCVDDLSALALGADLLIHYGHSCLVPIDATKVPCLYVFVDIKIDVERLISTQTQFK
ncbi:hypothetical protein GH714_001702 [Hevea brasiliensis]|uniref:2-(3-amino-3-carboxypropyl)histidine synthase subunit 1 n=1 Tax=Hevea brasiliensis TaxID=3981 RepID=A0A6A6MAB3_HEVBR|nr:hypothetical protein GH714_001702 [Hevea brasiliensis]